MKKLILVLILLFWILFNKNIFAWFSMKWQVNKFNMQCNTYYFNYNNDYLRLFFNQGKDYFAYNLWDNTYFVEYWDKNWKKYQLPEELIWNKNIKFKKVMINNSETIITFDNNTNEFIFILKNWYFSKYKLIKNKWDYLILSKKDEKFILLQLEDKWFLINIWKYNFQVEDIIYSKDNNDYIIKLKLENNTYLLINNGKKYGPYLDIFWINFLKTQNKVWFFWLKKIDEEKQTWILIFSLNWKEILNIFVFVKDWKQYYKIWKNISEASKFSIEILGWELYYYFITDDDKFKLFKNNNLLIETDWSYIDEHKSSENDKLLTIKLLSKESIKIISNNSWKFKIDYSYDSYKLASKLKWIKVIWVESFDYINNKIYYIIWVKKESAWYIWYNNKDYWKYNYQYITNKLEFNNIPNFGYNKLDFLVNYNFIVKGNFSFFIAQNYLKNEWYILDVNENIIYSRKVDKFTWWWLKILWIDKNNNVINYKKENNLYNIYINRNLIWSIDKLDRLKIVFSKDNNRFFIKFKDYVYFSNGINNWEKINDIKHVISYSNNLKFLYLLANNWDEYLYISWKKYLIINNIGRLKYHWNNMIDFYEDLESWIWTEYICSLDEDWKISLVKQLANSKHKLQKNKRHKDFITKFDKFIIKISDEKLLNLNKKVVKISNKLKNNFKYKDIINYLEAKTKLEILKRDLNSK